VEIDYKALKKPSFSPPGWVFGPVWVALYTLMGYGSYRAWTMGMASFDPQMVELTNRGSVLYIFQLGVNMLFIPLFFGWKRQNLATADIVLTTSTVGYLIKIWSQVDEVAAWCLVPYVVWLSLASCVTVSIGYMNKGYFDKKASKDQ
jgi:translocator protein